MTKEELMATHPDYDANIEQWRFFLSSYFGGRHYRDGNYLLQHPFESSTNYERRKKIAYYYNYCGPIVDIMVSHLFRRPVKREFGRLATDNLFSGFLRDVDFEGSNLAQFMRDAGRFASVYGRVTIVVDRPRLVASTRGEAEELGLRPYLSLVTPENLIDWSYGSTETGRPVLEMVKINEGNGRYRIWTTEAWELWQAGGEGDEPVPLDGDLHDLGRVPVVNLYNKKSGVRMIGTSDIQDISDINKNIYYLCSDAKEIIENTAFPMLAVPYEKGGASDEREIGPRNIIQFDPESGAKPFWLEPPHSSLTEIREWVKQDIGEIHRIAKMGGVRSVEDFARAKSGVALELEYQQLYAVLSEKADNLEQAEMEVLSLWSAWEGKSFDGLVDYPDDFSLKDLDGEISRLFQAMEAGIDSVAFRREAQKSVVDKVMPKLNAQLKAQILKEIDGDG
ncbi:hypothetical protein MNBD_DELTA01-1638 [hydrothermal vent metagenome]|uniref:Portal protein n=1 Tax=hydrothermal vent metagenome TaxID=652676 RepID=A0A3B0RGU2_9ZZZZ